MQTVACVLVSGGIYDADWVQRLRHGVAAHMGPHRFVCLTDTPRLVEQRGIETITILGAEGWWSKIELFRPGLFTGPTLYLDLDSIVVGSLNNLVRTGDGFTAVKMWGQRAGGICSTAMSWCGDMGGIWTRYTVDPLAARITYDQHRPQGRIGDQAFIEDALADMGQQVDHWPHPWVCSYKDHAIKAPPPDARVVAFHGKPKPPQAVSRSAWVAEAWR